MILSLVIKLRLSVLKVLLYFPVVSEQLGNQSSSVVENSSDLR